MQELYPRKREWQPAIGSDARELFEILNQPISAQCKISPEHKLLRSGQYGLKLSPTGVLTG
jgi:hypothetical protein